jgi:hypothetical protein
MSSFTGCIFLYIPGGGAVTFLLVFGITAAKEQEEPRPWVTIGSSDKNSELIHVWAGGGGSLKELGEIGSRCENKSHILKRRSVAVEIAVEMEVVVVDGVPMYCLDLKEEDPSVGRA